MDHQSSRHAKLLILSHIMFVCTSRKKLLLPSGDEMNMLCEEIAARSDCSCEAMEGDQDHIPCLVKSEPRISPVALVRNLKQESTFQLWQRHGPDLKKPFWKERTFWSDGSLCCTVGNANQETIRQYIA